MRMTALAVMAPMVLGACLGGGGNSDRNTESVQTVSHDAFVASLNGAYVWNCTLKNEAGQAWQFILANSNSNRWTPVVLREAGARFDQDLETRAFGAATRYILRDRSEVLVAADGEARGEGQDATKPGKFTQGQCTRGNQT